MSDELGPEARQAGAVNTLTAGPGGRIRGGQHRRARPDPPVAQEPERKPRRLEGPDDRRRRRRSWRAAGTAGRGRRGDRHCQPHAESCMGPGPALCFFRRNPRSRSRQRGTAGGGPCNQCKFSGIGRSAARAAPGRGRGCIMSGPGLWSRSRAVSGLGARGRRPRRPRWLGACWSNRRPRAFPSGTAGVRTQEICSTFDPGRPYWRGLRINAWSRVPRPPWDGWPRCHPGPTYKRPYVSPPRNPAASRRRRGRPGGNRPLSPRSPP